MDETDDIFHGRDESSAFAARVSVSSDGSHLVLTMVAYGVRVNFAMPPGAAMALGYDLVAGSRTAKAIAVERDDEDELDDELS